MTSTASTASPARTASSASPAPIQASFEELSTPLREVTFVVVDLETTGASAADCAITEIGAVKVRGGEVLGEFQTLVNPGVSIPAFIAVLTGISDLTVAGSPAISSVLPAFLEFTGDAVIVAHNAPFDVGFLRAACARQGLAWPAVPVVDTVRLARQTLTRDEAPNCKLETLSRLFRATTVPNHRALSDARATVDVLHALLERVAGLGVHDLASMLEFSSRVSPHQRRKRHLADGLPARPGVYLFRDATGRVLYVGKSGNLRSRVRSYFTAAETRRRMVEMIALAESVDTIPCVSALEAEVRELRLIVEHKPPYNRRSRHPERSVWVKLTAEAFPRLSLVRAVKDDGGSYAGPFGSRRAAESAIESIQQVFAIRQCTPKLSARKRIVACILSALGRCGAPCDGRATPVHYDQIVAEVRALFSGDTRLLLERTSSHLRTLAAQERYEDAAAVRDRLSAFLRGAARTERTTPLIRCPQLVAARRLTDAPQSGWEIVVVRHGRLAAAAIAAPGVPPMEVIAAAIATAEADVVGDAALGGAPGPLATRIEETECLLRWLSTPGVRLVEISEGWTVPVHGAIGAGARLKDGAC